MSQTPLDAELQFKRLPDQGPDEVYEVWLYDETRSGRVPSAPSETVRVKPDGKIESLELSPRQFVSAFRSPGSVALKDGLQFGHWLEQTFFPIGSQRRVMWDEILKRARRESERCPVRLQVSFADEDNGLFADLPFELLGREGDFYFRRPGWSVVRAFRELDGEAVVLGARNRIGLLWANPLGSHGSTLDAALFAEHEQTIDSARELLSFDVHPPCRQATRSTLSELAEQHCMPKTGLDILAIVAHGSPGLLWLHQDGHPDFPKDPGQPLPAAELAHALREAQVKVALLWSCHAAQGEAVLGSVARALLAQGNLAAVVGSQAALRADLATTPRFARELLGSLATLGGPFDRAVADARRLLDAGDLQWAAPLYYARPLRGESVSYERDELPLTPPGTWSVVNAPPPTPHFCGRIDDVDRALDLLRTSRCVTFTGLPGAGKSELARAVVDRLGESAARPVDRAVWVGMAGMCRPAELRGRIAAILDLSDVDDDDALARRLRADRRLIILDNAEDLIGSDRAGLARLMATLLTATTGVQFLLTSRQPLGDPLSSVPEREHLVGMLPPPFDRAAFVAAAGARLSPEDLQSGELSTLVALLAGHPRSLVLIAGQVGRGATLGALHQRIANDTIDAITAHELVGVEAVAGSDAELCAKRLASSLNLAYAAVKLESAAAAELFCWLGLFPSGMPALLLNQVFGAPADERLTVLLRHSLAVVHGPDRRIVLPAPLRWYAAQQLLQLTTQRRTELLGTTCSVWAAWLQHQCHYYIGTTESRRAVRTAAEETENLTSLWDCCLTSNASSACFDSIAQSFVAWGAIESFAGRSAGALTLLLGTVDGFRTQNSPPAARAAILKALGDLQIRKDRLREAEESYRAALTIYRQTEYRLGEANTLQALGRLEVRTARLREAEESYRAALQIYRTIEDRLGEADTLQALGVIQIRKDRLREAEESYRAALPIYRQIEDRLGEANTLKALGVLQVRTARLREAEESYLAALQIFRQIDDQLGEANTLRVLGHLQVQTARLREAEESYRAALTIYRQIESRLGEADMLQALGVLHVRTARLREAEESYRAALPIYRQIEDRLGEANTLKALGDFQVRTDRLREAEESYRAALPIYRQIEYRLGEANTLQGLGSQAIAEGSPKAGFDRFLEALAIQTEIEDRLGQAGSFGYLARAAAAAGETVRSIVLGARAWRALGELEDHFGQALALMELAKAFADQQDEAAGAAFYLAWLHRKTIDDPGAADLAKILTAMIGGFDGQTVAPEFAEACGQVVNAAVRRQEEELAAAGVHPLSPLSAK